MAASTAPAHRPKAQRPPRLVTAVKAAEYRGCHPASIRIYMRKGLLTVYRVPGKRAALVDLNELDRIPKSAPSFSNPEARVVRLDAGVEQ